MELCKMFKTNKNIGRYKKELKYNIGKLDAEDETNFITDLFVIYSKYKKQMKPGDLIELIKKSAIKNQVNWCEGRIKSQVRKMYDAEGLFPPVHQFEAMIINMYNDKLKNGVKEEEILKKLIEYSHSIGMNLIGYSDKDLLKFIKHN